jgi:hypothetical protein
MKNIKELLKRREPEIKKLVKKVSDIASVVKKDAIIGARYGGLKVKALNAERQRAAKIYAIGKRTLDLYHSGEVTDETTVNLCKKVELLREIAKKYSVNAKEESKKIKFKKT